MSEQTTTTLEHQEQAQDEKKSPFLHAFCIVCNAGQETSVSMCGAKKRPTANLMFTKPPGELCVVCAELAYQRCQKCGC